MYAKVNGWLRMYISLQRIAVAWLLNFCHDSAFSMRCLNSFHSTNHERKLTLARCMTLQKTNHTMENIDWYRKRNKKNSISVQFLYLFTVSSKWTIQKLNVISACLVSCSFIDEFRWGEPRLTWIKCEFRKKLDFIYFSHIMHMTIWTHKSA